MSFLQALLMGILQGLTEFLPISSSGHIVIFSYLYKKFTGVCAHSATSQEELFSDIIVHLGTLVAVLIYFRKDIIEIIKDFMIAFKTKNFSEPKAKLPVFISIGTIFTAIIALPLEKTAEHLTSHPMLVSTLLIVTGIILFMSELVNKKYGDNKTKLNWINTLLI